MSQDLQQYQQIIEQLKPMIHEPEFNQVLSQVASHVSKDKRFLIKMELKRLARPCIRLIDLRGLVDGECRLFEYAGRSHYLDDNAVEVFERQVRLFGEYTIGVYEAVTTTENNFRVMYKKRIEQERQLPLATEPEPEDLMAAYRVPAVTLFDYPIRYEERMNYAVAIEIFTDNNKSIQASTVDMSVSGLRVKVSKEYAFKLGDRLMVHFRGLEGEYTLDKKNGIAYNVVTIDKGDKEQKLSLQRLFESPTDTFDNFLQRFIHGNKRRYKVNMDNTLQAIQNKTYEQYFTPTFPSVPVYIEKLADKYQARYLMSNDCNKENLSYWSDEQGELRIGYLLSDNRIKALLSLPAGKQETFVYVFNHVNQEKVYFYSASQEELQAQAELQSVYLGFGARKASWRIFKLQLTPVSPQDAHVPLSLPNSVSDSIRKQNQPPAPRLMARLKNLTHIALITDVTNSIGLSAYQAMQIRRNDLSKLRIFCHPRNRLPANIDVYRFKYVDLRKENRYQLRSKVTVTVDDIQLEGVSEDISVHGIKVELNAFYHQQIDSLVLLSFPQLQKVTRKFILTNLQYRVTHINSDGTVLHLEALDNDENDTAQRFFDELIRNNKAKLTALRNEEQIPGIGAALRNIRAKSQLNISFFIKKEGASFLPEAVSTANHQSRLSKLLAYDAASNEFNLRLLYRQGEKQRTFIQDCLRQLKSQQKPLSYELFICFDPSQRDFNAAISSEFSEHFASDKLRKGFINNAISKGQFIAIKIFLARTGRPDNENIQSEINYVSVYAIHRAKILEEQIWNICAVGNILDVTDEVMCRYGFSADQINANQQEPIKLKVGTTDIQGLLNS